MSDKIDKRITEQSSLYEHLEKMSVDELTALSMQKTRRWRWR